jgi:hypothetical protein
LGDAQEGTAADFEAVKRAVLAPRSFGDELARVLADHEPTAENVAKVRALIGDWVTGIAGKTNAG